MNLPIITPKEALHIINQAADNITLDGKNHKVLAEAIRVLAALVDAQENKPSEPT